MRLALLPFLLVLPLASAQDAEPDLPQDVEGIAARIASRRDDVEPELVRRLGEMETREAMEALLSAYDEMASIYMRREVLRALARYDRVEGAEQPALQKLLDVATTSKEKELRDVAVSLLGSAPNYGKAFLRMIVESPADDAVREEAMRLHVRSPRAEDEAWYRKLWRPWAEESAETRRASTRRSDEEEEKRPRILRDVRVLAFEALADGLGTDELLEATKDQNPKIRVVAVEELEQRGEKKALPIAERIFEGRATYDNPANPREKYGESSRARLAAARILLRERGSSFAKDLVDEATRSGVSREFSFGVAEMIRGIDDPKIERDAMKGVSRAKGDEKLFWMRVVKESEDPRLDRAIEKASSDKDPSVRREAALLLAERGVKDALPGLERSMRREDDPVVLAAILQAITTLRRGDPEWKERIAELTRHDVTLLRNAAIDALGRTKDPAHVPLLEEAIGHDQWSTRLTALSALEGMRVREALGPIVRRMPEESGRMRSEFADALWRSTGQPFGMSAEAWKRWWEAEKDEFEFVSEFELQRLAREAETRRLKETTRTAEFFGIRIDSKRVVFVIDVSGSMNERTLGKYQGDKGDARMEVAKRELVKALEALGLDTLFNIVTFESAVQPWKDRIVELNETTLAEAKQFVGRLGASGGTNLYGALEHAFDDPDVDTIFVLSDGEPSVGVVTDPLGIRMAVQGWNEHRGVRVHCIAVGGQFRVLEWIAADSGGEYLEFP